MPSASALPYLWSPDGAHDFLEGDQEPRAASSFVSELSGVMSHLQVSSLSLSLSLSLVH